MDYVNTIQMITIWLPLNCRIGAIKSHVLVLPLNCRISPIQKLAKGKDILTDLEQQLVSLKKKFLYAAYNSLTLNAQSYIIKI